MTRFQSYSSGEDVDPQEFACGTSPQANKASVHGLLEEGTAAGLQTGCEEGCKVAAAWELVEDSRCTVGASCADVVGGSFVHGAFQPGAHGGLRFDIPAREGPVTMAVWERTPHVVTTTRCILGTPVALFSYRPFDHAVLHDEHGVGCALSPNGKRQQHFADWPDSQARWNFHVFVLDSSRVEWYVNGSKMVAAAGKEFHTGPGGPIALSVILGNSHSLDRGDQHGTAQFKHLVLFDGRLSMEGIRQEQLRGHDEEQWRERLRQAFSYRMPQRIRVPTGAVPAGGREGGQRVQRPSFAGSHQPVTHPSASATVVDGRSPQVVLQSPVAPALAQPWFVKPGYAWLPAHASISIPVAHSPTSTYGSQAVWANWHPVTYAPRFASLQAPSRARVLSPTRMAVAPMDAIHRASADHNERRGPAAPAQEAKPQHDVCSVPPPSHPSPMMVPRADCSPAPSTCAAPSIRSPCSYRCHSPHPGVSSGLERSASNVVTEVIHDATVCTKATCAAKEPPARFPWLMWQGLHDAAAWTKATSVAKEPPALPQVEQKADARSLADDVLKIAANLRNQLRALRTGDAARGPDFNQSCALHTQFDADATGGTQLPLSNKTPSRESISLESESHFLTVASRASYEGSLSSATPLAAPPPDHDPDAEHACNQACDKALSKSLDFFAQADVPHDTKGFHGTPSLLQCFERIGDFGYDQAQAASEATSMEASVSEAMPCALIASWDPDMLRPPVLLCVKQQPTQGQGVEPVLAEAGVGDSWDPLLDGNIPPPAEDVCTIAGTPCFHSPGSTITASPVDLASGREAIRPRS